MRKPIDSHARGFGEDVSANNKSAPQKNFASEFIQALKSGDEAAYNKLVSEQHQHILDFLISIIKSREDAEEITQDIFLYIWQHRETIENIYGYMYRMAKTRALNVFRQNKMKERYISEQSCLITEYADSPEDITQCRETELCINEIVSSMPESMKRIYNMKFIEGHSNNEIADRLSTSSSNVRLQISNAIKRIKDGLEK